MVERTLSLAARTLDGIPDDESFFYLKEAVKCYLHGLPEASVALARAAVEAGLRKRASKAVGKEAVAAADLKRVIDEYSSKARLLSREGRARAHRVRVAANDILHQRSRGTPDALRAVEDAREVILELGH
jgi:hypothetical protein